MSIRMPLNLKNKLCNMYGTLTSKNEIIDATRIGDYHRQYVQGPEWSELELDLYNDFDSLAACYDWFNDGGMISIGPYENITPKHISNSIVTFHIVNVNFKGGSWEDWFVQDEVFIECNNHK